MKGAAQRMLIGIALLLAGWLAAGCAPPEASSGAPAIPTGAALPESARVIEAKLSQAPTRAAPLQLTILYTNDVRGRTDPCG